MLLPVRMNPLLVQLELLSENRSMSPMLWRETYISCASGLKAIPIASVEFATVVELTGLKLMSNVIL